MPLYYFDVHDGISVADHTGTELADMDAVKVQAVAMTGRLLIDDPGGLHFGKPLVVSVRNEENTVIYNVVVAAKAGS